MSQYAMLLVIVIVNHAFVLLVFYQIKNIPDVSVQDVFACCLLGDPVLHAEMMDTQNMYTTLPAERF